MWRYVLLGVVVLGIVIYGFTLIDIGGSGEISANAILLDPDPDISGYARAVAPYDWQFPRDHGPHPEYQTEWWYYTGNLGTQDGRRFGYQMTIFRRAITPTPPDADASEWRTNQVYLAHFTVTDVEGDRFYHHQRFSRGGADLAGATVEPGFRVWLEDWQVVARNDDATLTAINAEGDGVSVDLTLEQVKPPALQGEGGLSPKSDEPGNASYYYSLSRLLTEGTVTVDGETFTVSGTTWMDHEFSTSALGSDAVGWDWYGLHLDDNRELMLGQIRLEGGGIEPVFGGTVVFPDGSTRLLDASAITVEPTGLWASPHTGATYPAGWALNVDTGEPEPLRLTLTPLVDDQELTEGIAYWEGAVRITGDVTGYGYVELTGYAGSMNGRF
jgi:predicted secreted hydrolase